MNDSERPSKFGLGKVIAAPDVETGLAMLGALPDFETSKTPSDREILFVPRRSADSEIYYVDNRKDCPETVEARVRVTGRVPEIWHADTGTGEPDSFRTANGITIIPLEFQPEKSIFVVFRKPSAAASMLVTQSVLKPVAARTMVGCLPVGHGRASVGSPFIARLAR